MSASRRVLVLFGEPGRGGFNEAGLAGAQRAQAAGIDVEVLWLAGADPAVRTQQLRALCVSGPDLVVTHGGQGDVPVAAVAPDFPRIAFAVTQGHQPAVNVAVYEVLQEHSAFLAGILAGARAGERGHAAHLSGERVRPGLQARAAYVDGVARSAGPHPVLTGFCGHQHDPGLAQRWTSALAGQGAGVVFAMLDGGRAGVSQACRESGIWQIGNVLDWVRRDPAIFLASALADSGRAVSQALRDHANGQLAVGQAWRIGLEDADAVRLVLGADVSAQERTLIDTWAHRLVTGEVVPAHRYAGPEFSLDG